MKNRGPKVPRDRRIWRVEKEEEFEEERVIRPSKNRRAKKRMMKQNEQTKEYSFDEMVEICRKMREEGTRPVLEMPRVVEVKYQELPPVIPPLWNKNTRHLFPAHAVPEKCYIEEADDTWFPPIPGIDGPAEDADEVLGDFHHPLPRDPVKEAEYDKYHMPSMDEWNEQFLINLQEPPPPPVNPPPFGWDDF